MRKAFVRRSLSFKEYVSCQAKHVHTNQCKHLSTEPNHRDFSLGARQNAECHVSKHAVFCTTPFNQIVGRKERWRVENADENRNFINYMLFEINNKSINRKQDIIIILKSVSYQAKHVHTNQWTHLSMEPNHRDFSLGACQNAECHVSKHAVFCTTLIFNHVMIYLQGKDNGWRLEKSK